MNLRIIFKLSFQIFVILNMWQILVKAQIKSVRENVFKCNLAFIIEFFKALQTLIMLLKMLYIFLNQIHLQVFMPVS